GIPTRERNNEERPRVDNPGDPPNDLAGIVPNRRVRDVFKADDKSIEESRKVGFTLSHVVPRGQMLPGKGALILLNDGETDAIILKEDVSLFAQFSGARGMYPTTVIAVMAKWRDLYRQAMYKKQHQATFASNGGGIERPRFDQATEAIFEVIDGLPVFFNAWNSNYMHQAYHLADELGFNLILGETKQAFRLTDKVRAAGKPVVVSLDLPEDKSEKAKKKKEDEEEKKKELTASEKEKAALAERRQTSLKEHYSQAAMLARAGVPIAFSTINAKAKDVPANLRTMVENGLSEDAALAALTTAPAELFGISAYAGTVSPGKLANLVVSTKPYFSEDAQVRYVFVEGTLHEYEVKKEKKKGATSDEATPSNLNIAGVWSYEVEIPGQVQTGIITISGSDGDFSGEIKSDEDDEVTDINGILLNGNILSFTMDMDGGGQSMTLEFELELDGDSYEGEVSVGEFGTFPISGSKIPE
ncbi:MAG: amidohydrolase family protein, partial [Saprospiraceae bacterium]|nr:amidohydrolase family protein [Saprospiraceae bacterium]